ncbi:hypothetical protein [Mycobacterium colombiense]|uniref:hypothetical protein n=1 Tax=Mycobacterium colombiense TaxID=339268 RepID=UPI000801AB3B|nr:hypothetical protein [Mycobacterium colombiense]OBJ63270.1 hypothetical protein A5627_08425 [Mycobacterium colombiense]
MAKLRIPAEHRAAVVALTHLPEKSIEELAAKVEAGPPSLVGLHEVISGYFDTDTDAVTGALTSLAYVIATTPDFTIDGVTSDIREQLGEDAGDADLTRLLGSPRLVALTKTVDLRSSYERILRDFRILTDIRPVFGVEVEEKIQSAIVTHVARLTYLTTVGTEEFFVGLTHKDLLDIQDAVSRALTKEKRAHDFIEARDARVLDSFKENE